MKMIDEFSWPVKKSWLVPLSGSCMSDRESTVLLDIPRVPLYPSKMKSVYKSWSIVEWHN